jgi:hypothetical protein
MVGIETVIECCGHNVSDAFFSQISLGVDHSFQCLNLHPNWIIKILVKQLIAFMYILGVCEDPAAFVVTASGVINELDWVDFFAGHSWKS